MKFRNVLLRLIHIETLFFIGLFLFTIYLIFFHTKKSKKFSDFVTLVDQTKEGIVIPSFSIPSRPKPKPKKINKHEERCREIFEEIFSSKFRSVRPDWLKNPATGQNLELDGYCPYIKTPLGKGLAFEYDGEQHAKYNKHFHRGGPEEFIYQTKKDSWKDMKCRQEGVLLIRIPHFVAFPDLERYIKQKLTKADIDLP